MRRPGRATVPDDALEHLRAADPVLRGIIDRVGPLEIHLEPELWWSMVDAIVAQQLSVRAAATISARLEALVQGEARPAPADILAAEDERLRACGLSGAKVRYVKDLAARWLDGSLRQEELPALPDEEVIELLTRVKGIGRWTAEMVLMFTLGREDVLPVDDLAIRVAARRAYGLAERPVPAVLREIAEPWKPWRTYACRYLWSSLQLPAE